MKKHLLLFVVNDDVNHTVLTAGYESIALPDVTLEDNQEFKGWYFDEGTWKEEFTSDYYLDKAFLVTNSDKNRTIIQS